MKLNISLNCKKSDYTLPINYQYPLSAAIYRFFSKSNKEFSEWLHSTGFIQENKRFKLFTYSNIYFDRYKLKDGAIHASGNCSFYFSAPVEKSIIKHFVNGILSSPILEIGNHRTKTVFSVRTVEVMPEPEYREEMHYKMLSPFTASIKKEHKGSLKEYYLRHEDDRLEEILANNLLKKHSQVSGKDIDSGIKIELDKDYIKKRKGKVSKLITIKEDSPDEHKIKAIVCPVKITAPPAVQKTLWVCGLGEKNSVGFGCVEVI